MLTEAEQKLVAIKLMSMLGPVSWIHIATVIDGPEKTLELIEKKCSKKNNQTDTSQSSTRA